MNRKLSISVIFLIFLLMGSVSAYYGDLYDDRDGEYVLKDSYDDSGHYYKSFDSNEIVIDFFGDNPYGISIYVPGNDYYLQNDIEKCIANQSFNPYANSTTLKEEIGEICRIYNIDNPEISFKSPYGNDSFLYAAKGRGHSMEPTLSNNDTVIMNKTHDFQVGDIVVAYYSPEDIFIGKRVAIIDGDEIYLISDNVNRTEVKYGKVYEYEGLRTWVNMSDIQGVLVDSYYDPHLNNEDLF